MTNMMTYVNEIDLSSRAIESIKDSMVNEKISTDFSSILPMHAHTVKLSVLAQPAQRGQADKNLIFNVKLAQPVQAYFAKTLREVLT